MARNFLPRFRSDIERLGRRASCVIATEGRYELQYVPFEHVNRSARLAIVGITPGTTQIALSYDALCNAFATGLDRDQALASAKAAGAFGGSMRGRLNQMIHKFRVHETVGVQTAEDIWEPNERILHSTSVVPHAAFKNGRMFNGSFAEVLRTPLLRASFEMDLLSTLPLLPSDTRFVAVGRTPWEALTWCIENGHLRRDQVLGAFPHPSGNAGSQVDYFTGKKKPDELKPGDPVLHRLPWLDQMRAELENKVAAILGLTITSSAADTAQPHTRQTNGSSSSQMRPVLQHASAKVPRTNRRCELHAIVR
jgi:hypothetical protein